MEHGRDPVALVGSPGVGKSVVAAQIAKSFGAGLYFDLASRSLTAREIVRTALLAGKAPLDSLFWSLDEQGAYLRRIYEGKLVVFDHASEKAPVEMLCDLFNGSRVLFTTRGRLPVSARLVEVEGLDADSASHFANMCSDGELDLVARRQLVAVTRGSPLAIRLAVALVRSEGWGQAMDFLTALDSDRRGFFVDVGQRLASRDAELRSGREGIGVLLEASMMFGGAPISTSTLAEIWGVSHKAVLTDVQSLSRSGLVASRTSVGVTPTAALDWLSVEQRAPAWVDRTSVAEKTIAAINAAAEPLQVRGVARVAPEVFQDAGATKAFVWLEEQWPAIQSFLEGLAETRRRALPAVAYGGLRTFADLAERPAYRSLIDELEVVDARSRNDQTSELQLLLSLAESLEAAGDVRDAIDARYRALHMAKGGASEAWVNSQVAALARLVGELSADSALNAGEQLLSLARDLGGPSAQATALVSVATAYRRAGSLLDAIDALRSARAILEQGGDADSLVHLLISLSEVLSEAGLEDEALGRAGESVELSRSMQNIELQVLALCAKGDVLTSAGDVSEASHVFQEALDLARSSSNPEIRLRTLLRLGRSKLSSRDPDDALALLAEASALATGLGNSIAAAETEMAFGDALAESGDLSAAREQYLRAFSLCDSVGSVRGSAVALRNLGLLSLQDRETDKALVYLNDSHERFQSVADRRGIIDVGRLIGGVFAEQGRYVEAVDLLERCVSMAREDRDSDAEQESLSELLRLYERLNWSDDAEAARGRLRLLR